MNCNCVTELTAKIKEKVIADKHYKKPVRDVRFLDSAFIYRKNTLDTRTTSRFEIELEGQKKKEAVPFTHSFCPFCGKDQRPRDEQP